MWRRLLMHSTVITARPARSSCAGNLLMTSATSGTTPHVPKIKCQPLIAALEHAAVYTQPKTAYRLDLVDTKAHDARPFHGPHKTRFAPAHIG